MTPLRIGLIGFERVNGLDLAGPAEAFASAMRENGRGKFDGCYEVILMGLTRRPFPAESGLVFQPATTIAAAPKLDTLIVPGGAGLRVPDTNRRIAAWIAQTATTTRRVAPVCTGIYRFAAAGFLHRRGGTTHLPFFRAVPRRVPAL